MTMRPAHPGPGLALYTGLPDAAPEEVGATVLDLAERIRDMVNEVLPAGETLLAVTSPVHPTTPPWC